MGRQGGSSELTQDVAALPSGGRRPDQQREGPHRTPGRVLPPAFAASVEKRRRGACWAVLGGVRQKLRMMQMMQPSSRLSISSQLEVPGLRR